MTNEYLRELVTENPMLIEITRFRRRYFSATTPNSANGVLLVLIAICYAVLVLIVAQNRTSMSPVYIVMFETGLLTILAPMTLYGAIAGERERRSWDLLLAAPITKAQIVVGKFVGAMAALGIAILAFQIPIGIATAFYPGANAMDVLCADIVSVSFLMCVCALTILFSARVKRGLMALGATLGSLVSVLIVFPSVLGLGIADRHSSDFTLFLHPFYVLTRINEVEESAARWNFDTSGVLGTRGYYPGSPFESYVQPQWWGWPQAMTYLGLAVVLLAWASQTLNFAENEVKFMPQGQKNA